EQRRLAQIRAAEQESFAARQQMHTLLHSAEQALAAGQLQTARAAADEIRTRRPGAGLLPKPTLQRLSRLTQQLKDLEGWESFGQQAALPKQVRERREEFTTAAAAHAPTLLVEPRDWRTIERWLREADRRWHDGDLGSVEPKAWRNLDARFDAALAPLQDALS